MSWIPWPSLYVQTLRLISWTHMFNDRRRNMFFEIFNSQVYQIIYYFVAYVPSHWHLGNLLLDDFRLNLVFVSNSHSQQFILFYHSCGIPSRPCLFEVITVELEHLRCLHWYNVTIIKLLLLLLFYIEDLHLQCGQWFMFISIWIIAGKWFRFWTWQRKATKWKRKERKRQKRGRRKL